MIMKSLTYENSPILVNFVASTYFVTLGPDAVGISNEKYRHRTIQENHHQPLILPSIVLLYFKDCISPPLLQCPKTYEHFFFSPISPEMAR